jgi:hypothetical protein
MWRENHGNPPTSPALVRGQIYGKSASFIGRLLATIECQVE